MCLIFVLQGTAGLGILGFLNFNSAILLLPLVVMSVGVKQYAK